MNEPTIKPCSDEHFVEQLAAMLKSGAIKWKDVPKRHREPVAKLAFGRYPISSFEALGAIRKTLPE